MEKARGLLALLAQSRRRPAIAAGHAQQDHRNPEATLDQYTEDLLDTLHHEPSPVEAERARAYLDIAAEFLGFVREPRAAELVRRRAACLKGIPHDLDHAGPPADMVPPHGSPTKV